MSNNNSNGNRQPSIFDSEKTVQWGGSINEFLWVCAGVNRKVLRQCPTDYAKYAGIGGTILSTAVMATFSGGYALYSVFSDPNVEVQHKSVYAFTFLFAILWGLLIFNLDRFMVNTMYSDGTHKITKEELKGGLPRIILAIFLGLVISTPIEMRIFRDKIDVQILKDKGRTSDEIDEAHKTLDDKIKEKENKIDEKNADKLRWEKEVSNAEDKLYKETAGTGLTRKSGYGPQAKILKRARDRKEYEANINKEKIDEEIKKLQAEQDELKKQRNEYTLQKTEATESMNGFTARFNALYEVTSPSNSLNLFIARICIMLLFVAIEVIPTLFKMMMMSGPYDDLLRAENHRVRVLSDKSISDVNDFVNTDVHISVEKNKARVEAELATNQRVLEKLSEAQSQLLEEAIELWKQEELNKVRSNPSAYVIASTSPQNNDDTTSNHDEIQIQ